MGWVRKTVDSCKYQRKRTRGWETGNGKIRTEEVAKEGCGRGTTRGKKQQEGEKKGRRERA